MDEPLTRFQRLLLGILLLEIPLRLDVHLDYHEAEAAFGALGGWNVSVATICLGVLYAAWLARAALQYAPRRRGSLAGVLPGLIYLGVVALSVVVAQQPLLSMFELFLLVQSFLLFLYLVRWVHSRHDVQFVVIMLILGLALESLCMLGLYAVGNSVNVLGIWARIDESGRVGGTVGSPNAAASYLIMLLPLTLGVLLTGWSRAIRMLAVLGFVLGAAALVTTLSRGGWVGCAAGIGLFGVAALWRRRISILVPVAAGLALLVVVVAFQQVILKRLTAYDQGSAYSRVTMMQVAMRVVEEAPILGSGANNMAVAMRPHAQSSDFRGTFMYIVHNRYLQILAETGIVGLAAWIIFLLTACGRGWRSWRANDRELAPLALGVVAGMAGEMLHMTVEVFGGRSQLEMLWILVALATILYRLSVSSFNEHQLIRTSTGPLRPRPIHGSSGATAGMARTW